MRHPELPSAKANRNYVMKQMTEAVNAISGATQATGVSAPHPLEAPGALAAALDDFDVSTVAWSLSVSILMDILLVRRSSSTMLWI